MRTRLATCTALALSAGMLLAGPASADAPLPVPSTEKAVPSFTAPKLTLPKQDGARAGVASAEAVPLLMSDLDGDGSEDMIVRTPGGNLHSITSSGNGTNLDFFRDDVAKEIIPIGNQGGSTAEPEVLVASEDGTLTLYSDVDPSGTPYAHRVGGGWQVYNKITSPGDVNGDGRADVVARTKDGQLYLYLATGNTSAPLAARTLIGGGWNIYDQVMGLGDGTGDGKGDLYARDTAGDLWFYAGTGDTARPFAARVKVGTGWHIYNQILPAGGGNLLARDNYGTLYYYQGKGNGTLAAREQASVSGDFAGIVQFAGGGGNPYTGKEGVYAGTSNGALYWYTNSTTGSLTSRTSVSDTGTWDGFKLTNLSSMDRDGFSDLAFQYNDDPEGHLYIEGEDIGRGWSVYDVLVGPGDLSGDGKGDLLARDRSGVLYLYKGNGTGTAVSSRIKIGGGWSAYNALVGAGDYTGDGRTDLIARTPGGDLYLYAGTGVATTPFKGRVKIGYGWNAYSKLIAPGDLNADGKADLLAVTPGGDLYRYLNTSPGKFTPRAKIGHGYQIYNTMS